MKYIIPQFKNLAISGQILSVCIGLSTVLVIVLLGFSSHQLVTSKNEVKATAVKNGAVSVIAKIDRNFYERFGDVQAFAFNKLALEMIDSGRATRDAQRFLNTMTTYYVLYDLMLVVDKDGKVIAANTCDKSGKPLKSEGLIGQDFSREEWFSNSMLSSGPEGGAWYSDFTVNPFVARIYDSNGWGMAFAAPIKDDKGATIGVWYNFASWKDVAQGIRKETEQVLQESEPSAFMLMVDRRGNVIDSDDESQVNNLQIDELVNDRPIEINYKGQILNSADYIIELAEGRGAYTYKGNGWKVFCFVPKSEFSLSLIFRELLLLTTLIIIILLAGMIVFLVLAKRISRRIQGLRKIVYDVSRGELAEINYSNDRDEIGQMTNSVKDLADGLKRTSGFANEIGNGNLTISHEPMSDRDVLGLSLIAMRDNLQKVKIEEEKRKWISEGLARFGELLRKNGTLKEVLDLVLAELVKYMKSNQGSFFIINDENENEHYLELISCYAWNKHKHLKKRIEIGQGLAGQAWQERETIYLTEIPNNYIKITSGLGDGLPSSIIIVPLQTNEKIFGVIEIASFKVIEDHQKQFLEKVGENIASVLATLKVTERTQKLLAKTQFQTEELQTKEEEMRQNMEELGATQEALVRKEQEYIKKIEMLEAKHGDKHVDSLSVEEMSPNGELHMSDLNNQ
jgi:hypothetical protein